MEGSVLKGQGKNKKCMLHYEMNSMNLILIFEAKIENAIHNAELFLTDVRIC